MAKNPSDSSSGYKISEGPVTSSSLRSTAGRQCDELTELPAHYGKPLLVAIARDPRTLFVCWSVDWPAAFAKGLPADRCAHVRIRQHGNEKTVAVEPMSGELRHRRARAGRDLCSRARLLRAAGDLEQCGYRQRSDDAVRFAAATRRSMSQPCRFISLFNGC